MPERAAGQAVAVLVPAPGPSTSPASLYLTVTVSIGPRASLVYSPCKVPGVVRREEKKAAQRRAILDTTIALVRDRGMDDTRVQDVIAQVGISEKTFFNYFPSKQAVLEAHAMETNELYAALLRNSLAQPDRPVLERLEEIIRVQASFFGADRDLMAILATRSGVFFGATGPLRERQQEDQRLLAELFADGQRRGELEQNLDPIQLAELFTAMVLITTLNWLDRWWPQEGDLEPRLLGAFEVFVHGCAAGRPKQRGPYGPRPKQRQHIKSV